MKTFRQGSVWLGLAAAGLLSVATVYVPATYGTTDPFPLTPQVSRSAGGYQLCGMMGGGGGGSGMMGGGGMGGMGRGSMGGSMGGSMMDGYGGSMGGNGSMRGSTTQGTQTQQNGTHNGQKTQGTTSKHGQTTTPRSGGNR